MSTNLTYACDLCEYVASNEHLIARHKDLRHSADTPSQYRCYECGWSTNDRDEFNRHTLVAHPPPIPGAVIDQAFGTPEKVGTEGAQRTPISREDYLKARAVLDALPPGFYAHCAGCGGWYQGGKFKQNDKGEPLCEGCK